ncbi:MAG: site-specific recombinase [Burkholderiaceae bacterium]|nr:site-specific recombinase [Burkholderiaceae bacterium]
MAATRRGSWDLTALVNAADPRATRAERHLWLIRLVQWLRHGEAQSDGDATPLPVLRLKHLLNMLERNAEPRARVVALLARLWRESDVAALFADFGFAARHALWGEVAERLRRRILPGTPDTDDLAALLPLLFSDPDDAGWIAAIDAPTLARLSALFADARNGGAPGASGAAGAADDWRAPLLQAVTWLVSAIRGAAFEPALRRRIAPGRLAHRPFEQLVRVAEALEEALLRGDDLAVAQQSNLLRGLLQACRDAADSVHEHLEEHGVSVDVVFEVDQLKARTLRLEAVLDMLLAEAPARELQHLLAAMVALLRQRRSLRALLASHYSLLARQIAERHAETGEHYITRNRDDYRAMLRAAAGGGAIIAGTTFAKFAIAALALAPFWAGVGAGLNYAGSFVLVQLLHWTVATKQPAMTAPAMADKLAMVKPAPAGPAGGEHGQPLTAPDPAIEGFVDEVANLVRSQIAGIVGNLAAVTPLVLMVQWLAWWLLGRPLVDEKSAQYVLHSITLLGPTALFAAFTGVLLFTSSLIAGWTENWFVYHRLDSALAHHPAIVARLGAPRAARWAAWWRSNISGLASNVSLGMMLGLVPVLMAFVGLPIEVRHVTLSTGQLMAAASTLGWATLAEPAFWWCVAGLGFTGVLNLGVSFTLALRVALRSRGVAVAERRRLNAAIWRRLRTAPLSFLRPD